MCCQSHNPKNAKDDGLPPVLRVTMRFHFPSYGTRKSVMSDTLGSTAEHWPHICRHGTIPHQSMTRKQQVCYDAEKGAPYTKPRI